MVFCMQKKKVTKTKNILIIIEHEQKKSLLFFLNFYVPICSVVSGFFIEF